MIALRLLAASLCAALLLGGTALHFERAPTTTLASFSDTQQAAGEIRVEFSVASTCTVWATSGAIDIRGGRSEWRSCVMGNGDVSVRGTRHVFLGAIRHAGAFSTQDNNHEFRAGIVKVDAETHVPKYALADFVPGGRLALAAGSGYQVHPAGSTLRLSALPPGLHYIDGAGTVDATSAAGRYTVVARDGLTVNSAGADVSSHTEGALFVAYGAGDPALYFDGGQYSKWRGRIEAPNGGFKLDGQRHAFCGQLLAASIRVTAQSSIFDPFAGDRCGEGLGSL